jgi:hypothetical protein
MNLEKAFEILSFHQQWRQGVHDEMPYSPRELTEALDVALEELRIRLFNEGAEWVNIVPKCPLCNGTGLDVTLPDISNPLRKPNRIN